MALSFWIAFVCVCALYIIWQSKYRCQQVVECARETRGSTDVCVFIFSGKQAQIVVAHEYFNISIVRFSIENFTHFTHTCWNKKAALWIIHCDFGWLLHSQPSRTVGAINMWSRILLCVCLWALSEPISGFNSTLEPFCHFQSTHSTMIVLSRYLLFFGSQLIQWHRHSLYFISLIFCTPKSPLVGSLEAHSDLRRAKKNKIRLSCFS